MITYLSSPLRWPWKLPSGGRHSTDSRRHCPEDRKQDLRGGRQRGVRQDRLKAAQTGAGRLWACMPIDWTQRVAWHLLNSNSLCTPCLQKCVNCAFCSVTSVVNYFLWHSKSSLEVSELLPEMVLCQWQWSICDIWRFIVCTCCSVLTILQHICYCTHLFSVCLFLLILL